MSLGLHRVNESFSSGYSTTQTGERGRKQEPFLATAGTVLEAARPMLPPPPPPDSAHNRRNVTKSTGWGVRTEMTSEREYVSQRRELRLARCPSSSDCSRCGPSTRPSALSSTNEPAGYKPEKRDCERQKEETVPHSETEREAVSTARVPCSLTRLTPRRGRNCETAERLGVTVGF